MSFPSFLKMNVFDPLGMKTTMVSDQVLAPAMNRAISYAPTADGFKNADYTPLNRIYGDGNVNTSVEDMVKWDQALYTDRLVKQSTLAEAFTPARLTDGSATNYGFGWTIATVNGIGTLSHGGSWVGFRTYIMRVPSERFSVIVLANVTDFVPALAAKGIANIYLGDKMPAKTIVNVDRKTLATYVGKYQLRPGLILDVSLDRGTLFAAPTGQPKLRLLAESETRFMVNEEIGMTFTKDATGKVTGLTFHQRGDHPATRLPE